jgi:hypothetical protein
MHFHAPVGKRLATVGAVCGLAYEALVFLDLAGSPYPLSRSAAACSLRPERS